MSELYKILSRFRPITPYKSIRMGQSHTMCCTVIIKQHSHKISFTYLVYHELVLNLYKFYIIYNIRLTPKHRTPHTHKIHWLQPLHYFSFRAGALFSPISLHSMAFSISQRWYYFKKRFNVFVIPYNYLWEVMLLLKSCTSTHPQFSISLKPDWSAQCDVVRAEWRHLLFTWSIDTSLWWRWWGVTLSLAVMARELPLIYWIT